MTSVDNNWYILGPGAMGCLWAANWCAEDTSVVLIQRAADSGATLEINRAGEVSDYPVATTSIEQLLEARKPIQRLLISTKAQHTQAALARLQPLLGKDATVLVVQNGLAVIELQQQLPDQQLFAGVTTEGAYRTGAMQITHAGKGTTMIGALGDGSAESLLKQLPTQGMSINFCEDIEKRLWKKFAINCAINPLTVKHQCRNGQLLAIPQARDELRALCREIQLIANSLKPADWFDNLSAEVEEVLTLTAGNINSMLQDVRNGRETELAQLNSLLVLKAGQQGIPCPINKALIDSVLNHQQTG